MSTLGLSERSRFPLQSRSPSHDGDELARVDLARRRIFLHFTGAMTTRQAIAMREAYREAIAKVGPGYTVLTYFTDFVASSAVQEEMSRMVELANQGGCRRAARVACDRNLGPYQVRRLAQKSARYEHRSFTSFEEAESYLDGRS